MNSVQCLDWDLSFKIGSDDTYQRPPHKTLNDYASLAEISDVAREIFDNLERFKVLKTQIEENERNDRIVQCMSLAGVLLGGALGMFFQTEECTEVSKSAKVTSYAQGKWQKCHNNDQFSIGESELFWQYFILDSQKCIFLFLFIRPIIYVCVFSF